MLNFIHFQLFFFSRVVRKSIARVLTVINQTQKENLRKFYKVRSLLKPLWFFGDQTVKVEAQLNSGADQKRWNLTKHILTSVENSVLYFSVNRQAFCGLKSIKVVNVIKQIGRMKDVSAVHTNSDNRKKYSQI